MMAIVPHVTSGSGLRKFQADGFLLDRVYNINLWSVLAVFILLNWLTPFHPQRAVLWQLNIAGIHKTYLGLQEEPDIFIRFYPILELLDGFS